jgi:DnaJ-class molecular chaperone
VKFIDCETCHGTGEAMTMVCYGGPPIETMDTCPDCDGAGEHPITQCPWCGTWGRDFDEAPRPSTTCDHA